MNLKSFNHGTTLSKSVGFVIALAGIGMFSGCATTGAPVSGMLYTDVHYEGAVTKPVIASKLKGEACAQSILGMVALGDSSIAAAAKAVGINEVTFVDHEGWSILGVFGKHCTIVYGNKVGAAPVAAGTGSSNILGPAPASVNANPASVAPGQHN